MTTNAIDELSPDYVGSKRIKLTNADPLTTPRSFRAVVIDVDYSDADEIGEVELPIELIVGAPTDENFIRQIFYDLVPSQVAFTPKEGGSFLIMVREVFHNKIFGTLRVEVEGRLNDVSVTRGQSV